MERRTETAGSGVFGALDSASVPSDANSIPTTLITSGTSRARILWYETYAVTISVVSSAILVRSGCSSTSNSS
jgi:hypothetical protein